MPGCNGCSGSCHGLQVNCDSCSNSCPRPWPGHNSSPNSCSRPRLNHDSRSFSHDSCSRPWIGHDSRSRPQLGHYSPSMGCSRLHLSHYGCSTSCSKPWHSRSSDHCRSRLDQSTGHLRPRQSHSTHAHSCSRPRQSRTNCPSNHLEPHWACSNCSQQFEGHMEPYQPLSELMSQQTNLMTLLLQQLRWPPRQLSVLCWEGVWDVLTVHQLICCECPPTNTVTHPGQQPSKAVIQPDPWTCPGIPTWQLSWNISWIS